MPRSSPPLKEWYEPIQAEEIASPALLVFPSRIEENINRMVSIAGDAERLRPHIKTHKMSAIVKMMIRHNIHKFKCSTVTEVEMAAQCGGKDILLAMQPVGTHIDDILHLQAVYPAARISVIADDEGVIRQISSRAESNRQTTGIWLDINNGMDRTGVEPGTKAAKLYRLMCGLPGLFPRGLHVYDGHIHNKDRDERITVTEKYFGPVDTLVRELKNLDCR